MTIEELPADATIKARHWVRDLQRWRILAVVDGVEHRIMLGGGKTADEQLAKFRKRQKAYVLQAKRMAAAERADQQALEKVQQAVDEMEAADASFQASKEEPPSEEHVDEPDLEDDFPGDVDARFPKSGRKPRKPEDPETQAARNRRRERRYALNDLAERTKGEPPNEDRDVEWAYQNMGVTDVSIRTAPSTAAWHWLELSHSEPAKFLEVATKRADAKAKLSGGTSDRKTREDQRVQYGLIDRLRKTLSDDLDSMMTELLAKRPRDVRESLAKLGWTLERIPDESVAESA